MRSAGVRFERQRIGDPAVAEITRQSVVVAVDGMGKTVEQAVDALEHRPGPNEPSPCQQRRANAGLRRPSGMQPLGPGAFGEIFDDAAGHAAGDAERIDSLPRIEAEGRADTSGRAHRTEHGGGVKACFVDSLRHHETETAQHFGADRDPDQRHPPVRIVPLAGRQHRRHDHGAGMHRAALKRVVEVLAMRRDAVDKGGARGIQRPPMPDRRARTVIVATGQCAPDIVLVARGDAETDDVDQQILALARGCGRERAGFQCDDFFGKHFRDRNFWQSGSHAGQTRKILV